MKKLIPVLLLAALLLCACAESAEETPDHTLITFDGGNVEIKGGGAKDTGSTVTISAGGTYEVTGTLSGDRTLVIDTGDDAMEVTLILNNADITCLSGPAIQVNQAKNFRLQLAAGSENRLVSGTESMLQSPDPEASGAALFSKDDMDIEGNGSLTVCGYINNGIACKNDLDINSGSITVTAANNGVRGSDSVQIKGGSLSVSSLGDGIKSTTADKADKGYIEISGGSVTVEAWGDGIQAATELRLTGGEIRVTALGDGMQQSSKALKAETDVTVNGCSLTLSANEDGIRALTGNVTVDGGKLEICSLADGICAGEKDSGLGDICVNGGEIVIYAAKHGLKARGSFTVSGGSVTALCGSDKQAAPAEGASYLLCKLEGAAGDHVLIGQESAGLEARLDYRCLLYVDSRLNRGEIVTVTGGGQSTAAIVG